MKDSRSSKLRRLEHHVTNTHVVLGVEKTPNKAEATVHVSGGVLHAESVEDAMCVAIDALVDKLGRLIKRQNEKPTGPHENEGGRKVRAGN